jgi:DivIVA domain-containing protein
MPLTPADVHNVEFKVTSIGKRGYDEKQVDDFLEQIENELARLIEENNDLKQEVERMQRGLPAGVTALGVGPESGDGAPAEIELAQGLAQENASLHARIDQLEAQLREGGAQPVEPPAGGSAFDRPATADAAAAESEQALSVLVTAQRTANEHVADARREADRLLSDARSRAEELTRDAEGRSRALDEDARRRYEDTMGGLEVKRNALHKHIDELGAFERDYRARLKSYLQAQMHDLDGRARILEEDMGRTPSRQEAVNSAATYGGPTGPTQTAPGS